MYSWQYFIKLPGIKDLDTREQYRRYSNLMLEASNNNAAAASSLLLILSSFNFIYLQCIELQFEIDNAFLQLIHVV